MQPQFLDLRILRGLAPALCVALLSTACVSEPLMTYVSTSGDESSATSGTEDSEGTASNTSAEGQGAYASSSACLVGSWEIDKPSYLTLFGAGAEGLGGTLKVDGVATVDFTETTLTSTYREWTVTGQSPEGDMNLVMNGVETSGWSVDEEDRLTLDGAKSTIVSTLTVSSGGQQMVLPVGDDVESLDLTNFTVACEADRATLSGSEGFLVLNRK